MARWGMLIASALLAAALGRPCPAAAAPLPVASGADPGGRLVGEAFGAEVCIANGGDVPGFSPVHQLVVPAGLTLTGVQYLGITVTPAVVGTCTNPPGCTSATGTALVNPETGGAVELAFGATLVNLAYPLGSFTPGQPAQCLALALALGSPPAVQLAVPRTIEVTPLFVLGADPLDNPQSDPPLAGTRLDLEVVPAVFTLAKTIVAPESETATGPNYPRTAELQVNVANGETVRAVQIADDLGTSLQFVAIVDGGGCTVAASPSLTTPGGVLRLDCGDVTGTTDPAELRVRYRFFVPELDALGAPVLDPLSPAPALLANDARAEGLYDPDADPGTPDVALTDDGAATDDTISAKALATQKAVRLAADVPPSGVTPGDTLEYALEVQVSDFFSVGQVVVTDVLGDGQTFDPSVLPTFAVTEAGATTTGSFAIGADFLVAAKSAAGETTLTIDLSQALVTAGADGTLAGDEHADGTVGDGPTTARIVFRSTIDTAYIGPRPGTQLLSMGDGVGNSESVGASVVGGNGVADGSAAGVAIATPVLAKSIYAFNGSTTLPDPLLVGAGDTLTYRLRVPLPLASSEDLTLTDFLPIPLFVATEVTAFSGAPIPPAGAWAFGREHDLPGVTPALATSAAENTLTWTIGTFESQAEGLVIDLLFTVTATNAPMADRLALADLAILRAEDSGNGIISGTDVVNTVVRQPALAIVKDIVSATNPGAGPAGAVAGFDDAWQNGDAGDAMTFALTIENVGSNDAFDVGLEDRWVQGGVAAQGYASCTLVSVLDGNGASLGASGDLFTGTLTIPVLPADDDGTVEQGERAIVTYTCTVDAAFAPGPPIDNTATLTRWASVPGGPSFATNPSGLARRARVGLRGIRSVQKTITGSSLAGSTPNSNINRGELLDFAVVVTLSEGTYPGFSLTDSAFTIPPVDCTAPPAGLTCSANVSTTGTTLAVAATAGGTTGTLTFVYTQQKTASGSNTATASSTTSGPVAASSSWSVDNPDPTLTKTFAPATADAGDVVGVTLSWRNTDANNPIFQCGVSDFLDGTVLDLASVLPVTTPAGYAFAYDAPSGTVTYVVTDPTTACPAGAAVAVFSVRVRSDVVAGTTLVNTATVSGRSLPAGHPNEAAGSTRQASDDDTLRIGVPASQGKTITATSEAATDPGDLDANANPPVAIGEVIDYRIAFAFPEGVTRNVALVDLVPAGLTVVAGSATLARTSVAVTAAADPGGVNAAAAGAAVPVALVAGAGQVSLALGDVTNADTNNGSPEAYVLSLRAVVANTIGNDAGDTLANTGRLSFDAAGGTPTNVDTGSVTVHVAEPALEVTKTATPMSASGGDTVAFTLTVANVAAGANAASAFDWTFGDTLPAELLAPAVTGVDAGTSGASVTAAFTGNVLAGTVDRLDPGESVEVRYTATVDPGAAFGQVLTNLATAAATSLPGARGSGDATPGSAGAADGERTGAGGVNDLVASGAATITIDTPSLAKTTLAPRSFYAVGETATFALALGLPRGTTTSLVLQDVLPAGLALVAGTVRAVLPAGVTSSRGASPLTEATPGFFASAAGTLTFDFADVTALGPAEVAITYDAVVENILAVQDGVLLTNTATLAFDDPNPPGGTLTVGPVTNATPVRAGEPNLEIAKAVTAGGLGSDAGDTVSWQVTISNTGSTTAFQVDWRDVMPAGLHQIGNTGLAVSGGDVLLNGTAVPVTASQLHVSSSVNANDTLELADTARGDAADTIQIAAGAALTITFDSVLMNIVTPGQVLVNETRAAYTSLVDGGRDNASDPGNVDDDVGGVLDNYEDAAVGTLTVGAEVGLTKTVAPSRCAIGAVCAFAVRVDLLEGTTPSLVVTDVLPAGLGFVEATIAAGNMGIVFGNPAYATRLGSGRTVQFDLGDVLNPANGDATDDVVTITLAVRPDNVTANQNGTVLPNGEGALGSEVFLEYGSGPVRIDFDADPTAPGVQGVPLTLVEPELVLAKLASPATQVLGGVVTFTVTVQHDAGSTADAFSLVLDDTLPPGLTFVPGSATLPPADVSAAGQDLQFRLASLTFAEGSKSFSYQASIDPDAVVGQPLANDLRLAWESQPGATGAPDGGRTGADGPGGLNDHAARTSASVTPTTDAFVDAAKTVLDLSGGTLLPGDVLEYTIVLANTAGPITGVTFVDSVPTGTTYVAGSLATTKGVADDARAPTLQVDVGALVPAETVTITFRVRVEGDAPAGTLIANQGVVTSDRTVPEPTDVDGFDPNGDQPTEIVVGGAPAAVTLAVQKLVALLTDADASGSVTPGDVMRYTILTISQGGVPATNVVIADTIPTGLSYVPGTASATGPGATVAVAGQVVTGGIPVLDPGATLAIVLDVGIDAPLVDLDGDPTSERFTNQATAASSESGPVPSDANGDPTDGAQPTRFQAVVPGQAAAPLVGAEKRVRLVGDADGDGLVDPQDELEYRIVLTNDGAASALDVRVGDTAPAGTTIVSGSVRTSQGIVLGEAPVSINVGTLAPGALVTITFRVRVDAAVSDGTVLANQALATGGNFAPTPSDDDGDAGNGRNPTRTVVTTDADLAVTKTAAPNPAAVGGEVTFTVVVRNDGPDSAPNVVLDDVLPAGVELLDVASTQGGCAATTTLTCAIGAMVPGASVTVTIVVRPSEPGTLRNVATATSDRNDPRQDNDTSAVDVDVTPLTDLSLQKTAEPPEVGIDEPITYTLAVRNGGPSPATGVTVADTLPAGVALDSATASQGTCTASGATVVCALGDLAAGAEATATIVVRRTERGRLVNTARVSGNEPDPDPSNDSGTAETIDSEICDNCVDDDLDGLLDRADPDCPAAADGGGAGLGDPRGQGTLAWQCARTLERAATSFARRRLRDLQRCVNAASYCLQRRPGAAGCIRKKSTWCAKAFDTFPRLEQQLVRRATRACRGVSTGTLLEVSGLGFAAEAEACAGFGVDSLATPADVALCVARRHACTLDDLLAMEVPRAAELLGFVGVDAARDFPCVLPRSDGAGARLDGPAIGPASRCEHTVKHAGRRFMDDKLRALRGCVDAVFRCVQREPGEAQCLAEAADVCARTRTRILDPEIGLEADLRTSVEDACTDDELPLDVILAPGGLGFAGVTETCATLGTSTDSVPGLAECLVRYHECRVDQLLAQQSPRAGELLGIGLGAPAAP